MNHSDLQAAADQLERAATTRVPIEPLTDQWPDLDVDDSYRIARINVDRRLAAGRQIKGHKVGLSSRAMQQQLGVSSPDYGTLLDDMLFDEQSTLSHQRFLQPRVEAEVAVVLGRPLRGPSVTIADVCRAVELLLPALEIVDSRIDGWRCRLADTIADNASSGAVVLGGRPRLLTDIDVRAVGVQLFRNGELLETGAAGAVLGNPLAAVAWLANVLAQHGVELRAGHVILPGSCTRMVAVSPGDHVHAEFSEFGSLACTFTKEGK